MPKNIVICLDGTGNHFNEDNSNVIKLFQVRRLLLYWVVTWKKGTNPLRRT